jgi:penicillin-binding protein 1A
VKFVRLFVSLAVLGGLSAILLIASLYFYVRPELPSVEVLKDVRLQTPMQVFSADGELISQFGEKRRIPVKLAEMPPRLIQAVLDTEDHRFFEHFGFDPIRVIKAALVLATTGEKREGASTITMQLARNFFLTREKAFMRKIKELFIAWHIERLLTKEEILELYLNKIELGHRAFGVGAAAQVFYGKSLNELSLAQLATIAGLPKAPSTMNPISRPQRSIDRRRVVLGRMLAMKHITLEEYQEASDAPVTAKKHGAQITLSAPYVAEMVRAEMVQRFGEEEAYTGGYKVYTTIPGKLQRAAEQAVQLNLHDYDERHGYRGVVQSLWEPAPAEQLADPLQQVINPAWEETAILDHLASIKPVGQVVPAVVTTVHEQAITVILADGDYQYVDWNGLMWAREFITDTRQGEAPKAASDILKEGDQIWLRKNEQQQWMLSQIPEASSALVSLDPIDGAIKALVGGYSFQQSQFNRATQAKRQVGSNIKPFIYSAALEQGMTLASIINDAPITQWDRRSGVAWRPKNSDGKYDGQIRMRVALGKSKNVVSVRLLRMVGLDNVINYLGRFGFNPNELPRNESLSLGSASLTPLEVAQGFASFANAGFAIEPYLIQRIENLDGDTVYNSDPALACLLCEQQLRALDDSQQLSESKEIDFNLADRIISEQNAFLMADMMRTAVVGGGNWNFNTGWNGTGWRARTLLGRSDISGKTGTTNDAKDTWFSGFTDGLVTTTWVGFDDMNRALGKTSRHQPLINLNPQRYNQMGNAMVGSEDGARVALPAWIRYMRVALKDIPPSHRTVPEGIVNVRIDTASGKLTNKTDYTSKFEYFIAGTEPTEYVEKTNQVELDVLNSVPADDELVEDIF